MGSGVSAPNESRSLQLKKCISFFEGKPIDASDVPSTVNAEQELQIIYDQLSNMFVLAAGKFQLDYNPSLFFTFWGFFTQLLAFK